MKAYVTTTAVLFGLLVLVHLWRAVQEGVHLFSDPWYVATTLLSALMFGWAIGVLRSIRTGSVNP